MKVILLQDVKGQGKKGDLINASDGYARNFLLPRKLAKEADAGSIKQIEIQKESEAFHIAEEKRKAEETRAFLSGKSIRFKTTGGADGRLYGSVTTSDIADELKKQHNIEIDRRKIQSDGAIKNFGSYALDVKLYPEIVGKINVVVTEK